MHHASAWRLDLAVEIDPFVDLSHEPYRMHPRQQGAIALAVEKAVQAVAALGRRIPVGRYNKPLAGPDETAVRGHVGRAASAE